MKFKFILPLTACWLLLLSCQGPRQNDPDFKVIAYLHGFRMDVSRIEVSKLTHINYAFAKVLGGEIRFDIGCPELIARAQDKIRALVELKKINPDLKILLSVGGWGAEGFSDAALTPESRLKFAKSGSLMIREYGFDGLDIDWEYPGQTGGGNIYRAEDRQNFTLMLKALRDELDLLGESVQLPEDEHYLLTIASGADQAWIDNTEMGEVQKYLDFINIMTYDFHSGLHPKSGHQSNLFKSDLPGASDISVEIAVNGHLNAGVPAGKIVIGIPFYGRYWKGVPDENNGLYQQANSVGLYKVYRQIATNYLTDRSFTRFWDNSAKVPYLYSKDSSMMISYDDEESIKLKTEYVKKEKLAGIMFWEYSQDHQGELLEAIYSNLKPRTVNREP